MTNPSSNDDPGVRCSFSTEYHQVLLFFHHSTGAPYPYIYCLYWSSTELIYFFFCAWLTQHFFQDMNQEQFLSGVQLIWFKCFSSTWLVFISRLKIPVYFTREQMNSWLFHGIITKWNANSLVQDLNQALSLSYQLVCVHDNLNLVSHWKEEILLYFTAMWVN